MNSAQWRSGADSRTFTVDPERSSWVPPSAPLSTS